MPATPSTKVAGRGSSKVTGPPFSRLRMRSRNAAARAGVRAEVEPVGDHAVVRGVEDAGRQRLGGSRRQVCAHRDRAGAVAIGDLDLRADALDPRSAESSGHARDHDRRSPVGGGALHHARAARAGLEVHDECVVGGARARGDVGERGAHARELAERHAELIDHLRAVRAEPAAAARTRRPTTVGTSASASASTGTCSSTVARRGSPIAPERTVRASVAWPGSHRNSVPSTWTMPAARAAASTRRASGASRANGFSQITCLPAAIAPRASSACVCGGVAIVTASTPSSARASSSDVSAIGTPNCCARSPRAVGIASDQRQHLEPRRVQCAYVRDAAEPRADHDDPERRRVRPDRRHVPRGFIPAAR